jgi:4,5-DOPA dioxygenase extradiol
MTTEIRHSAVQRTPGATLPALFIGHGSPTNALGGNGFADYLGQLGRDLPRPAAILCVSAHWVTDGPRVLFAERPKTIHDFHGFPPELYRLDYPAPGAPALAARALELLAPHGAQAASDWGLDHGAWAVLLHLYPLADIPVLQVSLDARRSLREHLELARALRPLRREGVLILGSGNLTHNLRAVDWQPGATPRGWAVEFDRKVADAVLAGDVESLVDPRAFGAQLWRQAHPTLEHYQPLLYALGAREESDAVSFPYEEMQMGTLSMRSVRIG